LTLGGHNGKVLDVAFSPDGRQLATASADQTVNVWEAETGREVLTCPLAAPIILGVAFSPDGQHLACLSRKSSTTGEVKIWDAKTGKDLLTIPDPTVSVRPVIGNVAFSPDGQHLAACNQANTFKLWDAKTGQEIHTFRGHDGPVLTVAFSPD